MVLPECLEQALVGNLARVIDQQNDLVVPGSAGADFLIARIGGVAARIAGCRYMNALAEFPELALRPPEATHPEHRHLESGRVGPLEGIPRDEMLLGSRDRVRPARQ